MIVFDPDITPFEVECKHCLSLLEKVGFNPADRVVLVFGEGIIGIPTDLIPEEIQREVVELLSERKKAEDSLDPTDRKLHFLLVELLDFVIRGQLNDHAKKCDEIERSTAK